MLYISTDYVFDGTNPPFHHDSPTNPLNEYGRMKRDGEDVVLKENSGKSSVRFSLLAQHYHIIIS